VYIVVCTVILSVNIVNCLVLLGPGYGQAGPTPAGYGKPPPGQPGYDAGGGYGMQSDAGGSGYGQPGGGRGGGGMNIQINSLTPVLKLKYR